MKEALINSWVHTKEHAMLSIQTLRTGTVSAVHDTKVAATIGVSTIFAGVTASDVAVYVGIALSSLLVIKTVFDIHYRIIEHRQAKFDAILDKEIKLDKERDRKKALAEAGENGKQPKRKSDY